MSGDVDVLTPEEWLLAITSDCEGRLEAKLLPLRER
jgi:hypothetical protein